MIFCILYFKRLFYSMWIYRNSLLNKCILCDDLFSVNCFSRSFKFLISNKSTRKEAGEFENYFFTFYFEIYFLWINKHTHKFKKTLAVLNKCPSRATRSHHHKRHSRFFPFDFINFIRLFLNHDYIAIGWRNVGGNDEE